MNEKRSIWTIILLVTLFVTIWYGFGSTVDWYHTVRIAEINKPLVLIGFVGTIIITVLKIFTFYLGAKNDRFFVKSFISARLSCLLLSMIIIIYTTYLKANTSAYIASTFLSTTYTIISIGYLVTSKNIKNVYYKKG